MSQKTNCLCDECRLANGEPPCPIAPCEKAEHQGPHKYWDDQGRLQYFTGNCPRCKGHGILGEFDVLDPETGDSWGKAPIPCPACGTPE